MLLTRVRVSAGEAEVVREDRRFTMCHGLFAGPNESDRYEGHAPKFFQPVRIDQRHRPLISRARYIVIARRAILCGVISMPDRSTCPSEGHARDDDAGSDQ